MIDAGMTDEADPNAEFGSSLAVGKFRGPGLYDYLVIGEPYRTVGGVSRAGRIHGIRGSASGPDWASTAVFYQTDFGETNENSDAFGSTLAAGYFGVNDSSEDLVIGSPMEEGTPRRFPMWELASCSTGIRTGSEPSGGRTSTNRNSSARSLRKGIASAVPR